MYSHEIDKKLKSENYYIDSDAYENICFTSPQISRVKYEIGRASCRERV